MRARSRTRTSARLGADFTKLWTASAISNIGDGVTMAAGPLLVASRTDDPALVAGAAFAQQLPWLLFSLISGAYVDRVDRRRLIVVVDLLRGLVLGVLALAILAGVATIPVIYAVVFLLGTGETVFGAAASARLPGIVPADRLAAANARLMATFTGNQFLAKPLGAYLFVVAATLPFGFDAATFLVAAVLAAMMGPTPAPVRGDDPRGSLRRDIIEGLRWLWRHRLLRTLCVSMGLANVVFCAAFAVFVLYVKQRLGLSDVGYGYLLTTFAVGGLLGSAGTGRLRAHVSDATLLRAGLVLETSTHLILALTTRPWQAAITLVVFGAHATVWGVIAATLRQRSVPDRLRGRVNSAYALIQVGGGALGSLLGGAFAQGLGITVPFWIAGVVMILITAAAWRPLRDASAGAHDGR